MRRARPAPRNAERRRRTCPASRGSPPGCGPSSRRSATTGARAGDSSSAALATVAAIRPARHCRCAADSRASSFCLASICAAGSRCCSAQPPHTPKCAQRGVTRCGGWLEHFDQLGFVVTLVKAAAPEADAFARQGARDEYRLAAGLAAAHHAFGFVREIGDHAGLDGGPFFRTSGRARRVHEPAPQAARNSSKCGSLASVSQARVRASSSARPGVRQPAAHVLEAQEDEPGIDRRRSRSSGGCA